MKKILAVPYYPFLFGVFPITYLYSRNMEIFSPSEPLRSLLISLAATLVMLLYFKLVLKDWHRSALLSTLFLLTFFSFGHAANELGKWRTESGFIITPAQLALPWLILFTAAPLIVMRMKRADGLTAFFNSLGSALLIFNLVTIAHSALLYARPSDPVDDQQLLAELRGDAGAEVDVPEQKPGSGPDIYYIILDSYQRSDALEKYYHFDNSAFVAGLQKRGFYVADQSRSNYMTTIYSLPSSLNLVYLNDLPSGVFSRLTAGLKINHVNDFLRARGYQTIHFQSGFPATDVFTADVLEPPDRQRTDTQERVAETSTGPTQFEVLLLRTTLGRLLYENSTQDDGSLENMLNAAIEEEFHLRRQRIQYAFTHLDDYAAAPGSHFIFAHIITPHNPYLYGPYGEPIDYNGNFYLLGDKENPERNIQLYTDQLQYVNMLTLDLVDKILESSETPPVIILQADHGHDTLYEWEVSGADGVDLRSAVLNAYYFPDQNYNRLYPSISPVNSFRVVLNQFFGTRYSLLPDRSYNHTHPNQVPAGAKPTFTDICAAFQVCSPDHSTIQ